MDDPASLYIAASIVHENSCLDRETTAATKTHHTKNPKSTIRLT